MNSLPMLTRYKAWADEQILHAAAQLPDSVLTADQPIIFGSILRTLHHVYAMDVVWQSHLQGRPHGYDTRNPADCPPLTELHERQTEIDTWFSDYATSLSDAAGTEEVRFDFIGGGQGVMTRTAILLHVVNHATYHRGHVAAMFYAASISPPTTDLPVFLHRNSA